MKFLATGLINGALLLATLLTIGIGWPLTVQLARLHLYAGLLMPPIMALAWMKFAAVPLLRWRKAIKLMGGGQQPDPDIVELLARGLGLDANTNPAEQLKAAYEQFAQDTEHTISATAETIFFHTAVSQAGQLDSLVLWRSHWQLIKRLVVEYCPGTNAIRPALYAYLAELLLTPNRKDDLDLAAQIGPALVGASIVGAIPGANLVSIIISDAVVQGSANALASLRVGLLVQRFFARQVTADSLTAEAELRMINQRATALLMPLVASASSELSRLIWTAARDHLKRVPSATLDSLKTMITKSLKGISGRFTDKTGDDIENLLPPGAED